MAGIAITIEDVARAAVLAGFAFVLQGEAKAQDAAGVTVENYYCGCDDVPRKHFPYAFAVLKTTKGDLLVRPEGTEGVIKFTTLAIRNGDVYCDFDPEGRCYGSFSHPCDFTDFRYGRYLAPYFPTCKGE